jgi:hypothetical protein
MFAGMQETNLGAMLDALRNNAEACKLEGNREFADGACRLSASKKWRSVPRDCCRARVLTRACVRGAQATWRRP